MKLYYYKDPLGNFGDDLNPYIWYNLAPEIFDDDDTTVLVGIGTLINSKAPEIPNKLVFGSGVGYNQFPDLSNRWEFVCVRGPLSAQKLGLDNSYVATDPANLLTQIVGKTPVTRTNSICFMPHHASARLADWRGICEKAGVVYIDPASDIHETIYLIRRSRLVIAEAMHAAIVADAFRTPWVPINCYDHILDFKWQDWCQSLQMDYRPIKIPLIWDMEKFADNKTIFKSRVKHQLKSIGIWSNNWTPAIPLSNREDVEESVIAALYNICTHQSGTLSTDKNHLNGLAEVWEKLALLKQRYSRKI